MPSLVGRSLAEASALLKSIGIYALFDGDGEVVVAQLPKSNTDLYLGEIVYLIIN